jgi:hypothetical protein
VLATGEMYEGWWVQDRRHGHGRMVDGQATGGKGSRFEGEFDKDLPVSGVGKLVYSSGGSGQRAGRGGGGWYAGKIVKGLRFGPGVMVYGNGDIYDGEWKSDLRHGYGCMIKGELVYEGIFVYDSAGEQGDDAEWTDYIEFDDTILQERVRTQLRQACLNFALPDGRVEILCSCLQKELLKPFLNGSIKPMLVKLRALQEHESSLLALDDAETVDEVVKVRHQGKTARKGLSAYPGILNPEPRLQTATPKPQILKPPPQTQVRLCSSKHMRCSMSELGRFYRRLRRRKCGSGWISPRRWPASLTA